MSLKLVTPATDQPVTIAEAKNYLRVDGNDENDLITALVKAATSQAETITNRVLMKQTWELGLDLFPRSCGWEYLRPGRLSPSRLAQLVEIRIPLTPLLQVTSITYLDEAGAQQTLDPATYVVDTRSQPGRIFPAVDTNWPNTQRVPNAVIVTVDAGYSSDASVANQQKAVPEEIKLAIKLMIADWYENRLPQDQTPIAAERLLMPFRVWLP